MENLYTILGVTKNSTDKDIKKAYRDLAKKYHPDVCKNKECEEKFKKINTAYEILKEPQKRKEYDIYGDKIFNQNQQRQTYNDPAEAFFSQFFGGAGPSGFGGFGGRPHQKRIRLNISLSKAIKGGSTNVIIEGQQYTVNLPAKVYSGYNTQIKTKNDENIVIIVEVQNEKGFIVQNNNIVYSVHINIKEAIFGTSKSINMFGKTIKFKIPKDTRHGQVLRIKDEGLKGGDLYIELSIVMPREANSKISDYAFIK